jgi:hypothetical protein
MFRVRIILFPDSCIHPAVRHMYMTYEQMIRLTCNLSLLRDADPITELTL